MKTISTIAFFVFAALSLTVQAQEETLFDDLEVMGAFGGPYIEIGKLNGEVGAQVGGGGALILNNLFIGGYGQGADYPEYTSDGRDYNIRFNHGGFWLGYAARPYKLVHVFTSAKLGWGKARIREDRTTVDIDRHFAITPELGIEINLTGFMKLSLTGGYRWVNGITKLPGLDNKDFSSPVGIITFRFGGFGNEEWNW